MTSIQINPVATRYASSLLDVAAEKKKVETIEKDINDLALMINESGDLRRMLGNPLISKKQKMDVVGAIAKQGKLDKITTNFLFVLVDNGRLDALADVVVAFGHELTKRRGEVEASIQTASALSAGQTKALQKELSKTLGSNVTLNVSVDKDLLGGMVVTVGSVMVDDSVRSKITRLGRAMGAKDVRVA